MYLVERGRIKERPRFYFDWLILAVLVIPSFGYVARGPDIVNWAGETKAFLVVQVGNEQLVGSVRPVDAWFGVCASRVCGGEGVARCEARRFE